MPDNTSKSRGIKKRGNIDHQIMFRRHILNAIRKDNPSVEAYFMRLAAVEFSQLTEDLQQHYHKLFTF